ncbi:MAG: acyltransferase [Beijerinckiaceae bacterium]|nr:acyltransferase [Beijerinckiaceae bacterium]MCI0736171.1 acyltransferase [Beijerinckiaceae bacterium]
MKFRYDINALRALAVTAVVLFHYKAGFVPGGFVGVDIFFVISGHLMTNIIMGRLAKSRFSIWEFYHDRAKRIIPGLLGMCFVLLAAGYFLLEPATYHYLGSTSIAALLFFSNFRFWETTGYFDPQSEVKWLLHTWSLSVEWQFYLAYPIMLMGLYKFDKARRQIISILWGMAFLSFASCVWLSVAEPASAFYLLPPRAWELIAGGIVALQFPNNSRRYSWPLLLTGLLFIGSSIAFYDKNLPWPYYWGFLPVTGTCLIIAANRPDASIFRNRLVQTIGIWSYSIYLWHWPVAVAAVYFGFTKTTPFKIASEIMIVAAILSAGWLLLTLSRKFLERVQQKREPVLCLDARQNKDLEARLPGGRRPGLLWGASALGLTLAVASTVTINEGLASRRPNGDKQYGAYEMALRDWDYPSECTGTDPFGRLRPCRLGLGNDRGVLFIGDSFAMQIYSRFAEFAKLNPDTSFTFLASPACPPLTGIRAVHDRFKCNGFADKALHFAEKGHFTRIMLVSNWYGYFHPKGGWMCFEAGGGCRVEREPSSFYPLLDAAFSGLRSRLLELKNRGTEIVIVGATPSSRWNVPSELAKRRFLGMDTADIDHIDRAVYDEEAFPVKSRLKALAESIGGKFVDPLDYLCDNQRCPTVDSDGVPYFKDECHYRSGTVRTSRFQFLDDATGVTKRVSAAPMPGVGTP